MTNLLSFSDIAGNTLDFSTSENYKNHAFAEHSCVVHILKQFNTDFYWFLKDQEELNDRLRKLEKWVWGAGAVIASLVTVFGIYSNVHTVPTFAEAEHKHGSYITTFDFLKWSNITK